MSYSAIVTRMKTKPHPDPEVHSLQLGSCAGYQVVTSKSHSDNQLGVYFPTDGQLSHEYCVANDEYPRFDENGKRIGGGYIDPKNRRVKAQNFRKVKSEGYWVPLECFKFTGIDLSTLTEGMEFTELNGIPVCNKYITKATREAMERAKFGGPGIVVRAETKMFKMHYETDAFKKNAKRIEKGAILTITEKLHGTSQRTGHVFDEEHPLKLPMWKKKINKFFKSTFNRWMANRGYEFYLLPFTESVSKWAQLTGSRKVILNTDDEGNFREKYRQNVMAFIDGKLRKGETIYYEVVGYTDTGSTIMGVVGTKDLQDKALVKKYGDTMRYLYGCKTGECRMFVYRATVTTMDGHLIDLPWHSVQARCEQLGVPIVPVLAPPFVYDGDLDKLTQIVESLTDGESTLDPSHIREGVCVRVEQNGHVFTLKSKSHTFNLLEGKCKDKEDYVDIEESS